MKTVICRYCGVSFEWDDDGEFSLFSLAPETCGKNECIEEDDRRFSQSLLIGQEQERQKILERAKIEAQTCIERVDPSSRSGPTVTWTSQDRMCARSIGDHAIRMSSGLDALIFLGESLVPVKYYMIDKVKTSVHKISGSFSGISISEVDDTGLEAWTEYLKRKLPLSGGDGQVKIGFVDYSATGKTFLSLGKVLNRAKLVKCDFVFMPVVQPGSDLPLTIYQQLKKDCIDLQFTVMELIPSNASYTCNTLLADEKMKKILGRRSRRLNLGLWKGEKELRKTGLCENMHIDWRKKMSLKLLDDFTGDQTFAQQPSFEETVSVAKRSRD
jgi:hypothetical protein